MSKGRKHRPGDSGRRSGGAGFQVIVAAHPGSDIRLGSELELVKAGLVYGDAVTLLSPITTMLLRVEGLGRFPLHQMIELIRRVAPYLLAAGQAEALETSLDQIKPIMASARRTGNPGAKVLLGEMARHLEESTADLRSTVNDLAIQAGIDKLSAARARGLVKPRSSVRVRGPGVGPPWLTTKVLLPARPAVSQGARLVRAASTKGSDCAAGRVGIREVPGSSYAPDDGVRRVAFPPQPGGEIALATSPPNRAPRTAGMDDEDIAVLVVDDHPGVRLAIEALIARTPGQRVVGSISSGAAAIQRARVQPTVLLIDPGMPGMNGVEATREIRKRKAAPGVVAFSRARAVARSASRRRGTRGPQGRGPPHASGNDPHRGSTQGKLQTRVVVKFG